MTVRVTKKWHCIVCDAHFLRALLTNIGSNVKVVSVHMTKTNHAKSHKEIT